jgi:hypothetical protein
MWAEFQASPGWQALEKELLAKQARLVERAMDPTQNDPVAAAALRGEHHGYGEVLKAVRAGAEKEAGPAPAEKTSPAEARAAGLRQLIPGARAVKPNYMRSALPPTPGR